MTGPRYQASHARPRRAGRSVVATLAGLWLIAAGLLGMRHEALVTHTTDVLTGQVVHASLVVGPHDATRAGVYPVAPGGSDGVCWLVSALHQPQSPSSAPPVMAVAVAAHVVPDVTPAAAPARVTALLRLAPKTSPPRA